MKAALVQHSPRVPQLLLVEDDVTLRKVLASFLSDTGAEVTCAGSLAEGRAHAERRSG